PPVNADAVRVRARAVEAFDPALRAEDVPRAAGAEAIGRGVALALGQLEATIRHDQVEIAGHPADLAIAIQQLDLGAVHQRLEAHRAAVAAAFHFHRRHGRPLTGPGFL